MRRLVGRRSRTAPSWHYVACENLDGRPHVMVDGAPRPGTVYTLSHWPATPTPARLRRDLSAEIVRAARERPEELPAGVAVASVDHYDVDGVVALGLLVLPGLDASHGPLLVEAARVGDFDVVHEADAARIAFALRAVGEGERMARVGQDGTGHCAAATSAALDLLPALAAAPSSYESLWRDEWAAYDRSRQLLADGSVTVEEEPALDLAVVRIGVGDAAAAWGPHPLHRAAVHSATTCLRVATVSDTYREFHFRYESWVRLAAGRGRARVDLGALAQTLTAGEAGGGRWVFDGAGSVSGALHYRGEPGTSAVTASDFVALVRSELARRDALAPAWDPYAED